MKYDILNTPDYEFERWFNESVNREDASETYKRAVVFFIGYYNKSKEKLINLTSEEMFEKDAFKYSDNAPDEMKVENSKRQECLIAFDKLYSEIVNYAVEKNIKSIEYFKDNKYSKEDFQKLVFSYFENNNRFIELIPDYNNEKDVSGYELLHNITNSISDSLFEYKRNNNFDGLENDNLMFICKYSRMLNLEAKMAHTSRMLYMMEEAFKDITNPKLKELVRLSVIYHDIGRFYQATYYPDFKDNRVSDVEQSDLLNNHAKVGYYFSIQKLISEDLIRCNADMDEVLLMHTLMATVAKLHQQSNQSMPQYDIDYSDCNVDDDTIKELIPIIEEIYSNAEVINLEPKHEIMDNIKFMEDYNIETVVSIIKAISTISEYNSHPEIHNEEDEVLKTRIDKFLRQFFSKEQLERLYKDPSVLTNVSYLEEMFGIDLPDDLKIDLKSHSDNINEYITRRFRNIEKELLDRDFAKEIDKIVNGENHNIPDELLTQLKQLMGAAMTITTDTDKLDIFNQRINGSWEKTNGSVYKKEKDGDLVKEDVIDDFCRSVFFSKVGEEPNQVEGDPRPRGYKISGAANSKYGINGTGNKIKALWFHIDQFITINMRNYKSFEYLKENNILDKVEEQMISVQEVKGKDLEVITELISEPIEFAKMFIDNILKYRVDGKTPTTFTMEQISSIRNKTVEEFKMKNDYIGDKPKEVDNQINSSTKTI